MPRVSVKNDARSQSNGSIFFFSSCIRNTRNEPTDSQRGGARTQRSQQNRLPLLDTRAEPKNEKWIAAFSYSVADLPCQIVAKEQSKYYRSLELSIRLGVTGMVSLFAPGDTLMVALPLESRTAINLADKASRHLSFDYCLSTE